MRQKTQSLYARKKSIHWMWQIYMAFQDILSCVYVLYTCISNDVIADTCCATSACQAVSNDINKRQDETLQVVRIRYIDIKEFMDRRNQICRQT